jgi:hypothetical protein
VIKGNDHFVSSAQFWGRGEIVPWHIRIQAGMAKFQNVFFKSHGKYIYFFKCLKLHGWKVKQTRYRPGVAQRVTGVWAPRFHNTLHVKVVSSSASRTGRLYPQECSWYSFSLVVESTPGAVGRKYITEKSSDTTGNRSRDRPTSSAVP